ncbi:MAG TPA: hypothetical protein VN089_01520 [Duganella sp.]|nr:hypothetical protein [Duganella sp.]
MREGVPGHGGGQLGVSDAALADGCVAILCVKTASRGDTILFKIAMSKNLENWSRMKKMSQMRHFGEGAMTLEALRANTEGALARARLAQFVANQSGS